MGQTFQPPVFYGLARAGTGDGQLSSCPSQVEVSKRGVHLGGHAEKVQAYVAQGLQKGSHERLVGIKSQRAVLWVKGVCRGTCGFGSGVSWTGMGLDSERKHPLCTVHPHI